MGDGRDLKIDTARGIACILLVAYHVIGSTPFAGMKMPDGHWLRDINASLALVRMPLFTILSGIVYVGRPVRPAIIGPFLKGKALRLLLPLLFVAVPFAIVQKITPGANLDLTWGEVLLVPVIKFAHFWFIQALFVVFIFVTVMEVAGLLSSVWKSCVVLAVSLLLYSVRWGVTDVFSLRSSFYLLPYFLSGVILGRFSPSIYNISKETMLIILVAGLCGVMTYISGVQWNGSAFHPVIGIASAIALLCLVKPLPLIGFIGFYSYTIYLFHVFGTAGTRILVERMGLRNDMIVFVASMVVGLAFPIGVHLIANRIPYVSRALLGVRHQRVRSRGSVEAAA